MTHALVIDNVSKLNSTIAFLIINSLYKMDKLRTLRTFISVAKHASFAEAARHLHLSATTVSRAIAALEAELGVQLLTRTTRSVQLTSEGAEFLAHCQAGVEEIDIAFATARDGLATPNGQLTITAPIMFGRLHVLPIIVELSRRYPELQIKLLLLDRVVNLVNEGVDIAIRIGHLPDSSLHMIQLGEMKQLFAASPSYLLAHGKPTSLIDLRHHKFIWIEDEYGPHKGWGLRNLKQVESSARFSVNNMDAAIAAAVAGLGIVRALSYQVANELTTKKLEVLFPDEHSPLLPVSLLFQNGRKNHPNIRAFISVARRQLLDGS